MWTSPFRVFLALTGVLLLVYAACGGYAYFRHDDWRMLGEGFAVFQDWKRIWYPSLISATGEEETWFFRPAFKILPALFYQISFGEYWGFLVGHLVFLAAGAWAAFQALSHARDRATAWAWLCLTVACFHLHAGSVLWLGEGMMNLPILTLLCFNLKWFVEKRRPILAFLFFFFSLSFKEAAVFHVFFLVGLVWRDPRYSMRATLPYVVVSAVYLVLRLSLVPVNPAYLPVWDSTALWGIWQLTQMVAFSALALYAVVWVGGGRWETRRLLPFIPFMGISLAPYVGHAFFSPGWVTLPLFFGSWAALYCTSGFKITQRFPAVMAAILVLNLLGSVHRLNERQWFAWGPLSQQFVDHIRNAPANTEELWVERCEDIRYAPSVWRVIGDTEMTAQAWWVLRGKRVPTTYAWCGKSTPQGQALVLEYRPPRIVERAMTPDQDSL